MGILENILRPADDIEGYPVYVKEDDIHAAVDAGSLVRVGRERENVYHKRYHIQELPRDVAVPVPVFAMQRMDSFLQGYWLGAKVPTPTGCVIMIRAGVWIVMNES